VGLVVVLLEGVPDGLTLGPRAVAELSALGITSAALVRDTDTVGLVLEGWAFDEAGAELAAAAVVGASAPHRTLRPLAQLAVAPAARTEGARA
jgi:hypothetical protein